MIAKMTGSMISSLSSLEVKLRNYLRKAHPRFLEFAHPLKREPELFLIGIPWGGLKSSRYGAFKGPSALRSYSDLIESWAEVTSLDLGEGGWEDLGDLRLSLAWTSEEAVHEVEKRLRDVMVSLRSSLGFNPKFGFIGGEHIITYPILKVFKSLGAKPLVLQFDAHLDLHDEFEGDRYSYACVMRRVIEDLGLNVLVIGARTRTEEEERFRGRRKEHLIIDTSTLEDKLMTYGENDKGEIYVSFDMDAFQPSIAPGVTNPVLGGLTYDQVMGAFEILRKMIKEGRVRIIGFDLVELNPAVESNLTTTLAAEILRELIGLSLLRV